MYRTNRADLSEERSAWLPWRGDDHGSRWTQDGGDMRTISTVLAIIIGGTAAIGTWPLHGQVPMQKTQAPGFFRIMVGDFEVTALNDGVIPWPTKTVLPTATTEQIEKGLFDMGLTDPVGMSYNAFLVNTG